MNVTAHQEKEKNKEMKTGNRRAGEERKRKQAIDFEEVVCYPSAVVQWQHSEKISAPINSRLNVVVRSSTPFGLGRNGCWPSRGSQLPRALSFIFPVRWFLPSLLLTLFVMSGRNYLSSYLEGNVHSFQTAIIPRLLIFSEQRNGR